MTAVYHRYTRKGVMGISHLNSLCMWMTDVPLYPHIRCAGKRQGDGDQFSHGWVFNTLTGKFKDHTRKQDHGRE